MSISSCLGEKKSVAVTGGAIDYRECGQGPTLVFVHGLLVNGDLWRDVVPLLSDRYRCVTPDLPLGAHARPMDAGADLTIGGVASLLLEFLERLELNDATLIANDTGGAVTQVALTTDASRIARLVLTSCDAYDNFLPLMFRPLQWLARVPSLATAVLQGLRVPAIRDSPIGLGWLSKYGIDDAVARAYVATFLGDGHVRRDCYKVLSDISPRYTNEAASKLGNFEGPVLVAWSADDRFFPLDHGRRLAAAFPKGRMQPIDDAYTFSSEDQPERLAEAIATFLGETEGATA